MAQEDNSFGRSASRGLEWMENRNPPALPDTSAYVPPPRPKPSMATLQIITELDLRFPPSSVTSPEDREAQLALLASDVATIPPKMLAEAAMRWSQERAYLPKASELIGLCRQIAQEQFAPAKKEDTSAQDWCDAQNATMASRALAGKRPARDDIMWIAVNNTVKLVLKESAR